MRINDIQKPGNISVVKKKEKSSASAEQFSLTEEISSAAVNSPAAANINPVGSIDAILAVQTISQEEEKASRNILRGKDLLNSLGEIRNAMLTGKISVHTVENIINRVKEEREIISDPALNEILDEIEVRVEVELAKLNINEGE